MSAKKLPGIYKITNKLNGRVYIGQSSDILHRFNYYKWGALSDKEYQETKREITQDIRKYGIDNFSFDIIDSGDCYIDIATRLLSEKYYINKYKATNPKYGYNHTVGGESGTYVARDQSLCERMKRAKPMFLLDITDRTIMLYLGGAKDIGDEFGYGKDVMSHTVKRGSLFLERYYLIPANYDERHKVLEKIRSKKMKQNTRAQDAFALYELAVAYIDLKCFDLYGFK